MASPPPNQSASYLGSPGSTGTATGSTAGTLSDRYMWVFRQNRLEVEQGQEHGKHMAWAGDDVELYHRGWFDPIHQLMFVVCPRPQGHTSPQPLHGIPRRLDHVLRRRFGDTFTYKIF